MKKLLNLVFLVILGFMVLISSCNKETFTEADAYASQSDLALLQDSIAKSQALLLDSLRKEGGIINYSVAAVDGSNSSWSWSNSNRGKGGQQLDAVSVTISQYGKVLTVITDESGIATFKDLRIGTINVNIRKTGYTEVDFVALLPALPDSSTVKAYDVMRSVATMVPVFSTTTNLSTISGLATVETDLTNDAPEAAANVKIFATVDIGSSDFFDRYIYNPYEADITYSNYSESYDYQYEYDNHTQSDGGLSWKFEYYGLIKQIAYHSTVSTATTAADGSFTLSVPSSPDGLPIRVLSSEFAANQSILQATLNNAPVWGTQSIRTIFGAEDSYSSYSSVPALGLSSGNVQSAFVQFSAPTGTAAAQPTTVATATAVLAGSGIASITVSNSGSGYAIVPTVEIVNNPDNGNGFGSGATATATVVNGSVTAITVTNAGSGYLTTPIVRLTVASSVMKAMAQCVVNIDGRITGVDFTGGFPYTKGFGYTSLPTVTFFPSVSGKGTGAKGVAVLNNGQIENVIMTNQGSGYTGKNNPATMQPVTPNLDLYVLAKASKTYIRDIYFGTGKRTIAQ